MQERESRSAERGEWGETSAGRRVRKLAEKMQKSGLIDRGMWGEITAPAGKPIVSYDHKNKLVWRNNKEESHWGSTELWNKSSTTESTETRWVRGVTFGEMCFCYSFPTAWTLFLYPLKAPLSHSLFFLLSLINVSERPLFPVYVVSSAALLSVRLLWCLCWDLPVKLPCFFPECLPYGKRQREPYTGWLS